MIWRARMDATRIRSKGLGIRRRQSSTVIRAIVDLTVIIFKKVTKNSFLRIGILPLGGNTQRSKSPGFTPLHRCEAPPRRGHNTMQLTQRIFQAVVDNDE